VQVHDDLHKWKVNLPVLVDYYPRIGNYSLLEDHKISAKWEKPVDLIYGGRSGYVQQDEIYDFKQGYPQMTEDNFYRVENAGHWVHFDQTKEFLSIVEYLLQKDEQ
jgi:pimeloyl-ACP methyl ester carboxylesterase